MIFPRVTSRRCAQRVTDFKARKVHAVHVAPAGGKQSAFDRESIPSAIIVSFLANLIFISILIFISPSSFLPNWINARVSERTLE